jgi:hypothetical protein
VLTREAEDAAIRGLTCVGERHRPGLSRAEIRLRSPRVEVVQDQRAPRSPRMGQHVAALAAPPQHDLQVTVLRAADGLAPGTLRAPARSTTREPVSGRWSSASWASRGLGVGSCRALTASRQACGTSSGLAWGISGRMTAAAGRLMVWVKRAHGCDVSSSRRSIHRR